MIVPVRCFTCGKVIGSAYPAYDKRIQMGDDSERVLDELGLDRYCCRRMIVSHANLIGEIQKLG